MDIVGVGGACGEGGGAEPGDRREERVSGSERGQVLYPRTGDGDGGVHKPCLARAAVTSLASVAS